MPVQCKTVLYPVKDLDKARALFAALFGADPHADSPYYVGFSVDGDEIGLVPSGHEQGMTDLSRSSTSTTSRPPWVPSKPPALRLFRSRPTLVPDCSSPRSRMPTATTSD